MKIRIPFEYEVSYVKARHRNPTSETFGTEAEFDIPEATDGDAKVLHEVGTSKGDPARDAFASARALPTKRVILHRGRPYVESCRIDELERLVATRDSDLGRSPLHVTSWQGRGSGSDLMSVGTSGKELASKKADAAGISARVGGFRPGTYRDDGGAEAEATIRARFEETVAWKGSIFVACSEPVLAVVREYGQGPGEGSLTLVVTEAAEDGWSAFRRAGYGRMQCGSETFRLDEKEAAVAYATALAEFADVPFRDEANVVSVDASALRHDSGSMIAKAAQGLVHDLAGNVLSMHPDLAEAYAELRDVVRGNRGLSNAGTLDAVRDVLKGIATHGLREFPEAADLAATALAGQVDLSLTVKAGARQSTLGDLVYAFAKLPADVASGRVWIAETGALKEASRDGELQAAEIASVSEMDRVLEGLGIPAGVEPPGAGGVVVAVSSGTRHAPDRHALVTFDSRLDVVAAVGPGGKPVPSRHLALAKAHASLAAEARPVASEIDRTDETAFDF